MPDIVHKQRFYGGLTSDTHPRQIAEGDYVYMLNMRNSKVEGNQFGGAVNIKGNVLIPFQLPVGENLCLGYLEDKQKQRVFYWVWNSFGSHQMLCYDIQQNIIYEVLRGDFLMLNREWLITQCSIVDGRFVQWGETKVEGVTVEGNAPRYVDTDRAILTGKNVKFDIVVRDAAFNANTTSYSLIVNTPTGQFGRQLITGAASNGAIPNDKADLYRRLKVAVNQVASDLLIADDCGGCKLELESKVEGNVWVQIVSTSERFFTLPQNRYHRDLDETSIKLGRLVPVCQPEIELIQDADFSQNFVEDRYFQFSVRYVYWDGQKSTFGAFSPIAGFNTSCAVDTSPYNAIRVDFSNELLLDEVRLADIKFIEIAVREGNSGSFRSVTKIDVCDLEFPRQTFVFRNDGAYAPIADEEAYRAANQIPLLATTHIVVDDRSWWGGTLERYDNLDCIDAKINIEYGAEEAPCVQEFVTIKGRIRISARLAGQYGNNQRWDSGVIWTDNNDTFWGYTLTNKDATKRANQYLPLGGFVAYIAGTPYYAISRQIEPTESGILVADNGAYIYTGESGTLNPIAAMQTRNGVWSEFEIKNVPKGGRLILRIASHLVGENNSYGEIYNLSNGLDWQKTSTYVFDTGQPSGTETIIDTNLVVGDEITVPDIKIDDLMNPGGNGWEAVQMYVYDGITDHIGDIQKIKTGAAVEQCNFNVENISFGRQIKSTGTDHNGFAYVSSQVINSGVAVEYRIARILSSSFVLWENNNQLYKGDINDLFNNEDDLQPVVTMDTSSIFLQSKVNSYIVFNRNADISEGGCFFVNGRIVDIVGDGLPGIKVVASLTNRNSVTDAFGNYSIRMYAQSGNFRVASVSPIITNKCCLTTGRLFLIVAANNINLPSLGGSFNIGTPFELIDFVAILNSFNATIWKRRNTVKLGIKYYDEYNRSSKVQTSQHLVDYIPFWTEDGASKGLATVGYEIHHTPPLWAKKYQIVRTLNPVYGRYLQYIVGEPRYVRTFADNVTDTSYAARDASEVYIPLQSLIDFADENSGSALAWDFQPGDRLTFMKDENGNWFQGFFDFKIQNDRITPDDLTYLVIKFDQNQPEIKPGATIELYSPKANPEVDFYYEISECYPIVNPGTADRLHGAGFNGLIQTVNSPATGVVRFGDTYLQNRTMPITTSTGETRIRGLFESEFMNERVVDSRVQTIGRFDIEDRDYGQVFYYTRHRFSFRYLPDTNINGLNQFVELDYVKDENGTEIDRAFGVAISTQFAGSLVLSIHQFKCVPIYINATPVFDLQGGSVLTKSRSIATIAQAIREDKGSQDPESIFTENGNVYGFDRLKNSWWRYGFNGLFDISDYEMNSYFDRIGARLESVADKRILACFDRQKDELVISLPGLGETLAFNETLYGDTGKNRWMTYYSFIPDVMGIFGEKFLSWKGGQLWLHDANPVHGSFYGVKYECGVDFYVSTAGEVKKVFKNVRIKATDKFVTAPRGIEVLEGEGRSVMVSELRADHVSELEGDYWADLLRDMDDREFANIPDIAIREVTALLRGRVLRGDYALFKLRNNSSDVVTLWSVDVISYVSQKTKE